VKEEQSNQTLINSHQLLGNDEEKSRQGNHAEITTGTIKIQPPDYYEHVNHD
jgi:hypothetical protein